MSEEEKEIEEPDAGDDVLRPAAEIIEMELIRGIALPELGIYCHLGSSKDIKKRHGFFEEVDESGKVHTYEATRTTVRFKDCIPLDGTKYNITAKNVTVEFDEMKDRKELNFDSEPNDIKINMLNAHTDSINKLLKDRNITKDKRKKYEDDLKQTKNDIDALRNVKIQTITEQV